MRQQITYIVSLLVCMLVLQSGLAQQKKKANAKDEKKREPLVLRGFRIETDLGSIISSVAFKDNISNTQQVSVYGSLSNKIYPTIEVGHANVLKLMADKSSFSTDGMYEKIGVDFRINKALENGLPTNNLILVGLRVGTSSFKYNINNLPIVDEYWGGTGLKNYDQLSTSKVWYELVGGIRVEALKNIYIGWNVRYKSLITANDAGKIFPWYVPGYGINVSSVPSWEFNYTLGYYFNVPKKDKKPEIQNDKISNK